MATFFRRITEVISANIDDMIDRVEDPDRMIKRIIREMEENTHLAKDGVIDAIASEKQLSLELKHCRERSDKWARKAEGALRAGNEELARAALARKKEHDNVARDLKASWENAKKASNKLKAQLRSLENKLAETRRKRATLAARQQAAEARQHMDVTVRHFNRGLNSGSKFVRMEERVVEMEARVEAIDELNDESSDLEREIDRLTVDVEVESELEALKKKIAA
ncbi:MAG: PspA/IM30 family protein [Desulfobacterales bacterium]|nr:PspA/IM30 family protein [Desulfobacterales bacterium]